MSEETLGSLVAAELSATELLRAEGHLDVCVACRELLGALLAAEDDPHEAAPLEGLRRGDRVDRYVVLELLGVGGMGVVYAAYDPELDRRVALKLLPAHRSGVNAAARLRREVRLLGRLSHRNLLRVHDVGEDGARLFFAMELVSGQTLRSWLRERPRATGEVLAVFQQAGHGLAAAHQAGVLHRDFKPDNVLCGRDGTVVVADFGLAQLQVDDAEHAPPRTIHRPSDDSGPPSDSSIRDSSDAPGEQIVGEPPGERPRLKGPDQLTSSGAVAGTPSYLAPERLEGAAATAGGDQFSFCVALYEGLYGERPFRGARLADLRRAILHCTIAATPPNPSVPQWLHDVLRRGLARDPSQRFASMKALLVELSGGAPARRRRWRRWAMGVTALLLVALALSQGLRRTPLGTCLSSAHASFSPAHAAPPLAAYAARWETSYREACVAAHLWRTEPADRPEAQRSCLELAGAEAQSLIAAGAPLAGLRDLSRCTQRRVSGWPEYGPAGDPLRRSLSQSRAFLAIGDGQAASREAELALSAARRRELGASVAEALLLRGMARGSADAAPAMQDWTEALWAAVAAHHDYAAAEALLQLASLAVRRGETRTNDHSRRLRHAAATIARLGGDAALTARLTALRDATPPSHTLPSDGEHSEATGAAPR